MFTIATERKWEEVDHELTGSVAGSLTASGSNLMEEDPLGLGHKLEYVEFER